MVAYVREGDVVVVHSMDRLARNLDDLRRLVLSLTAKGVRVKFVKENLEFSGDDSPMSHLLLSVMGAFAQFEQRPDPGEAARGHQDRKGEGRLQGWPGPGAEA